MAKRGIHIHRQITDKTVHHTSTQSMKEQRIAEQFEKEYEEKLEQKRKNHV